MAAVATTRAQLRAGNMRARNLAQVLQQQAGVVGDVGDICMAVAAVTGEIPRTDHLPSRAWQLFSTANHREVLRLAPAEYLRTAFGQDPEHAAGVLAGLLSGQYPTEADAAAWLDIAATSFLAGSEELSRAALERAVAWLANVSDAGTRAGLRDDAQWLRSWYGRRHRRPQQELPAIAVLSCRAPDRAAASRNLGDYLESLATLGQLVGQSDFVADTTDALGSFAEQLGARVGGIAESGCPTAKLVQVDRDASPWAQVPDGTWVVYTGALPQPLFGVRQNLPLDRRLRPIFLSVHVDSAHALSESALQYLREYGPIGCRDWSTVLLLQAADVPAFFAGSVISTLRSVSVSPAIRTGALAVDVPGEGDTTLSLVANVVRRRDLAGNLRAALEHVDALAAAATVCTSRMHSHLAARALGTPVDFRPENPTRRWLWGLQDVDDAALDAMRQGIADKLAAIYGAILAGKDEEHVYAAWRAACIDDVEVADSFRASVPSAPPTLIDVGAACATIRAASVTTERTAESGDGSEINIELSLDGNYKHQLEVVLDSIVTRTTRPVRAFVLCRDHTDSDYERMAALFPEVSFVWLPTDGVDYSHVGIDLSVVSVATMDRLLLPDLLPEVSRIVHHDLDAICLTDLAALFDVELKGARVAARPSPHQSKISGFGAAMARSERISRDPDRAHEFLLRTHTRHRFDYKVFNAGIMTLDLDAMRADNFCQNFLPYVERFGLDDNNVLCIYAGANLAELDPSWNWPPWLETLDEPKIAHWAGARVFKPWNDTWVAGRDLWRASEARVAERHARASV